MAALGQVITVPTARTDTVTATLVSSSVIIDSSIAAADLGRAVTGTGIPAGSMVGKVTVSTSFILVNLDGVPVLPTASTTSITLGGILIFQVMDGVTYATAGYTVTSNPNVFKVGTGNDPLPLLLVFPTTAVDIYLGGVGVTASSTGVGADIKNVPSLAYNCIGGDSLFGVVGSSTAAVQLLALRQ